jgi:mRNA interferase RelE/StbE
LAEASWEILITPPARRDLRNLDPPIRRRISQAVERLTENPADAQLVQLQGSEQLRLRVGDWRVRLRLDHAARNVVILRVLPRGRAYRD